MSSLESAVPKSRKEPSWMPNTRILTHVPLAPHNPAGGGYQPIPEASTRKENAPSELSATATSVFAQPSNALVPSSFLAQQRKIRGRKAALLQDGALGKISDEKDIAGASSPERSTSDTAEGLERLLKVIRPEMPQGVSLEELVSYYNARVALIRPFNRGANPRATRFQAANELVDITRRRFSVTLTRMQSKLQSHSCKLAMGKTAPRDEATYKRRQQQFVLTGLKANVKLNCLRRSILSSMCACTNGGLARIALTVWRAALLAIQKKRFIPDGEVVRLLVGQKDSESTTVSSAAQRRPSDAPTRKRAPRALTKLFSPIAHSNPNEHLQHEIGTRSFDMSPCTPEDEQCDAQVEKAASKYDTLLCRSALRAIVGRYYHLFLEVYPFLLKMHNTLQKRHAFLKVLFVFCDHDVARCLQEYCAQRVVSRVMSVMRERIKRKIDLRSKLLSSLGPSTSETTILPPSLRSLHAAGRRLARAYNEYKGHFQRFGYYVPLFDSEYFLATYEPISSDTEACLFRNIDFDSYLRTAPRVPEVLKEDRRSTSVFLRNVSNAHEVYEKHPQLYERVRRLDTDASQKNVFLNVFKAESLSNYDCSQLSTSVDLCSQEDPPERCSTDAALVSLCSVIRSGSTNRLAISDANYASAYAQTLSRFHSATQSVPGAQSSLRILAKSGVQLADNEHNRAITSPSVFYFLQHRPSGRPPGSGCTMSKSYQGKLMACMNVGPAEVVAPHTAVAISCEMLRSSLQTSDTSVAPSPTSPRNNEHLWYRVPKSSFSSFLAGQRAVRSQIRSLRRYLCYFPIRSLDAAPMHVSRSSTDHPSAYQGIPRAIQRYYFYRQKHYDTMSIGALASEFSDAFSLYKAILNWRNRLHDSTMHSQLLFSLADVSIKRFYFSLFTSRIRLQQATYNDACEAFLNRLILKASIRALRLPLCAEDPVSLSRAESVFRFVIMRRQLRAWRMYTSSRKMHMRKVVYIVERINAALQRESLQQWHFTACRILHNRCTCEAYIERRRIVLLSALFEKIALMAQSRRLLRRVVTEIAIPLWRRRIDYPSTLCFAIDSLQQWKRIGCSPLGIQALTLAVKGRSSDHSSAQNDEERLESNAYRCSNLNARLDAAARKLSSCMLLREDALYHNRSACAPAFGTPLRPSVIINRNAKVFMKCGVSDQDPLEGQRISSGRLAYRCNTTTRAISLATIRQYHSALLLRRGFLCWRAEQIGARIALVFYKEEVAPRILNTTFRCLAQRLQWLRTTERAIKEQYARSLLTTAFALLHDAFLNCPMLPKSVHDHSPSEGMKGEQLFEPQCRESLDSADDTDPLWRKAKLRSAMQILRATLLRRSIDSAITTFRSRLLSRVSFKAMRELFNNRIVASGQSSVEASDDPHCKGGRRAGTARVEFVNTSELITFDSTESIAGGPSSEGSGKEAARERIRLEIAALRRKIQSKKQVRNSPVVSAPAELPATHNGRFDLRTRRFLGNPSVASAELDLMKALRQRQRQMQDDSAREVADARKKLMNMLEDPSL